MSAGSLDSPSECLLCGRTVGALLYHLRVRHDILSVEDYSARIQAKEMEVARRLEFRRYVDELKAAMSRNEISADDYRRRVVEWEKTHPPA
jgi:hypothetical protein